MFDNILLALALWMHHVSRGIARGCVCVCVCVCGGGVTPPPINHGLGTISEAEINKINKTFFKTEIILKQLVASGSVITSLYTCM
jgi:hypothetical protein